MNFESMLTIMSQATGRDLSKDWALFNRARAAIGASLNQQGQVFVSRFYPELPAFLETPAGQKALQEFLTAWSASLIPIVDPAAAQEERQVAEQEPKAHPEEQAPAQSFTPGNRKNR